MQKLTIWDRKKGFEITDPSTPVIINDSRGILFYAPKLGTKQFNLPPFGNYFIESGTFKELPKPVQYPLAKLPILIRRFPSPFDFTIEFANNPAKCTVDWSGKRIIFDHAFKRKPYNELFFILYHEFAHAFFNGGTEENESKCDLMAGNYMLIRGFNPEQVTSSPITSLSSVDPKTGAQRNWLRKKNMVDAVLNAQNG